MPAHFGAQVKGGVDQFTKDVVNVRIAQVKDGVADTIDTLAAKQAQQKKAQQKQGRDKKS